MPADNFFSRTYPLKLKTFRHLKRAAFFLVGTDRLNIFAHSYIRMIGNEKIRLFIIVLCYIIKQLPF